MYQYIQGWKIDEQDYRWALSFSDWSKGLDLYGRRVWIEFDGDDCVVGRLWDSMRLRKLVKIVWLQHGFYTFRVDGTVFVIYRFGWSLNRNQKMANSYELETVTGMKRPIKIQLNFKKSS